MPSFLIIGRASLKNVDERARGCTGAKYPVELRADRCSYPQRIFPRLRQFSSHCAAWQYFNDFIVDGVPDRINNIEIVGSKFNLKNVAALERAGRSRIGDRQGKNPLDASSSKQRPILHGGGNNSHSAGKPIAIGRNYPITNDPALLGQRGHREQPRRNDDYANDRRHCAHFRSPSVNAPIKERISYASPRAHTV